MSNGTTNVDQANFYGISMESDERGFNEQDMGKYPTNIDPKAVSEELARNGEFVIATKAIGPKEIAAINSAYEQYTSGAQSVASNVASNASEIRAAANDIRLD